MYYFQLKKELPLYKLSMTLLDLDLMFCIIGGLYRARNIAFRFVMSDYYTKFAVIAFGTHIGGEYVLDFKLITHVPLETTSMIVT